jgi:hypothetical protein
MEDSQDQTEKQSKTNGGARPGAGRPKGSTHKLTARDIMAECERVTGKSLVQNIIEGYQDTLLDGDRRNRTVYEKMLLDKCATTLMDIEVTENADMITMKNNAFAAALASLQTTIVNSNSTNNDNDTK